MGDKPYNSIKDQYTCSVLYVLKFQFFGQKFRSLLLFNAGKHV